MIEDTFAPSRAAEFEARERGVLAAIFRRDQAEMTRLMSPHGFGMDATMGMVGQRELIDSIGALAEEADFAMDDVRVRAAGMRTVALTYRLRQWGHFGGEPLPAVVYCSSVWRVESGAWKAVFHHETFTDGAYADGGG